MAAGGSRGLGSVSAEAEFERIAALNCAALNRCTKRAAVLNLGGSGAGRAVSLGRYAALTNWVNRDLVNQFFYFFLNDLKCASMFLKIKSMPFEGFL